MRSLTSIAEQLQRHADAPLVTEVHGRTTAPASGAVLGDLIARARGTLRERGVGPGDRVALVGPNSIRWVATDLACLFEGAVVVPLYARQDPDALGQILADSAPALVIVADDVLADALAPQHDYPTVVFAELFGPQTAHGPPQPRADDDPVTLIYTSGTSGRPKGVILTARNIDFMLPATADALGKMMGPRPTRDRVFHYLPLCFAGSRIVLWTSLVRGSDLYLSTDLERLRDEMATARPHYMLNVPMLLERVRAGVEQAIHQQATPIRLLYRAGIQAGAAVADGRARRRDRLIHRVARRLVLRRVRAQIGEELVCLICGSAPLAPDTQRWFLALDLPVYQVYGLTETTAIVTMDQPPRVAPGQVGALLPGVEARLGPHDELQVRGPNVSPGYHNQPEATAEAFVDGWFRTGDQAHVDADGGWTIHGRVKNLLVPTSGHNVAPVPLEAALLPKIPGADAVVVLGHARPHLTALVSGADVDPAAIGAAVEALNATLPHYKRIRRWARAPEAFTPENGMLTANRKLKRQAVEREHADLIDRLYA